MSVNKLETIIYIVGPKRSWEFQLKHLKRVVGILTMIFLGLAGVIVYQYFIHIYEKEILTEQLRQEQVRNDKLISRIKQAGKQDPEWEQQILSQSTQQKKLNEQQAALIAQHVGDLTELRSILEQRERVVQQFQLEKKSTLEQINSLQDKARGLQQQLQVSKSSLVQANTENDTALTEITELKNEIDKNKQQIPQSKKKTVTKKASKNETVIKPDKFKSIDSSIGIENISITHDTGQVKVSYILKNLTKTSISGRAGLYISSKNDLKSPVRYRKQPSIPFKISRFRVVKRDFTKVKPNAFIRIVIWDDNKKVIIDNNYPISP